MTESVVDTSHLLDRIICSTRLLIRWYVEQSAAYLATPTTGSAHHWICQHKFHIQTVTSFCLSPVLYLAIMSVTPFPLAAFLPFPAPCTQAAFTLGSWCPIMILCIYAADANYIIQAINSRKDLQNMGLVLRHKWKKRALITACA